MKFSAPSGGKDEAQHGPSPTRYGPAIKMKGVVPVVAGTSGPAVE